MGYSYGSDEAPKMCFNAAKSWQLGWYADKAITLTPSGPFEFHGHLASIVDYPTTSDHVLIEIRQSSSDWAYYLNYNAAKGFNVGTVEGRNNVLITTKHTRNAGNQSNLLSKLLDGDSYSIADFNGRRGETLVVRFHSMMMGAAKISISLNGASTQSLASSPSALPSSSPSGVCINY